MSLDYTIHKENKEAWYNWHSNYVINDNTD